MRILVKGSAVLLGVALLSCGGAERTGERSKTVDLPAAATKGEMSLEETIAARRSVRSFSDKDIGMKEIGQILWAAQGITDERRGFRSAPSAGALYPLEVYAVTRDGVYHYVPKSHTLQVVKEGDVRKELSGAALNQAWVRNAPLVVAIAADYSRTTGRYRARGKMYVHMEVGHAAQNIHLQAVALGMASVPVGAFLEEDVGRVLSLPEDLVALYLIPVGYAR